MAIEVVERVRKRYLELGKATKLSTRAEGETQGLAHITPEV